MENLHAFLPMLVPLALFCVFLASLPTGIEFLRRGNDADPLRREMEREEKENKAENADEQERAA